MHERPAPIYHPPVEYSRNQNFGHRDRRSKNSFTEYTAEEMAREFAILDAGVGRNRK